MIFHKDKKIEEQNTKINDKNINTKISVNNLKEALNKNKDVHFKTIYISGNPNLPVTLFYIEGLVDNRTINEDIIKPLNIGNRLGNTNNLNEIMSSLEHGLIYSIFIKRHNNAKELLQDVFRGNIALIFDEEAVGLTFNTKGFDRRAITEPTGENVIKGGKDSFVETLRVNTATIRRKIASSNLVVEEVTVGKESLTQIAIIYIDGITNNTLVDSVKRRLENIEIDGVVTLGFIEEYIKDNKFSNFPQSVSTERPDKFCSNILEGRVGIITDGLPNSIIVPGTFNQFLQAPEDYSQNYSISSLVRLTRYILMVLTLLLPSLYISVTTFHQEMIPPDLALSIQTAKFGVPYPAFVEIILMLIAFEILQEAGLRLPKSIGQAVSIVGALVVGQAAVDAKLVSPAVVIVVAITGIAGFTMPNQDFSNAIRQWRLVMAILSSIIGLLGMGFGLIILLHHLSDMESFGVPYFSPFVEDKSDKFRDTIIRVPHILNKERPWALKVKDRRKQK